MPKKDDGMAHYRAFMRESKKFEKMGLHGTDYYIKRVEQLEAKVKRLEAKIRKKGHK